MTTWAYLSIIIMANIRVQKLIKNAKKITLPIFFQRMEFSGVTWSTSYCVANVGLKLVPPNLVPSLLK